VSIYVRKYSCTGKDIPFKKIEKVFILMETVIVKLGKRSYRIVIEKGLLCRAGELVSELPLQKAATVITNTTVSPLYLPALKKSLEQASFQVNEIIIPDGEEYKGLSWMEKIYTKLLSQNLDRKSPVIALGGGVVGDIAGFAASTFFRGVPFIQIPTTLLSQVDSSVGGKTGVNLPGGKNMVGSFYQPSIVIIDPDVLKTLDPRELRTGMAEVIKYGIISDRYFFSFLNEHMDQALSLHGSTLSEIIKTCCTIKAIITSKDETEKGIRSILNFGHTIGHAIETLTRYKEYKHGEAVSIGMAAASKLSASWGLCHIENYERVTALLKKAGLPTELPDFPSPEYVEVMKRDKKRSGKNIRMVLMKRIGEVFLKETTAEKLISSLMEEFNLH
jgi:3-dehydroquinate synthase